MNAIPVLKQLHNPHPLVEATRRFYEGVRPDEEGRMRPGPKEVKSDCCVVVEGGFGEFYFAVKRQTVHELRAELAPWLPRLRSAERGASDLGRRTLLEAVKELIALREQGDLTEEEFLLAKADLFQSAPEP